MNPAADIVAEALRQPLRLVELNLAGWEVLIRQARPAGLLGRIACMLEAQGSLNMVPTAPRAHLQAALVLAEAQQTEALRELDFIATALASTGVVPVLLKGVAYVAAGLLPAMGRVFGDVDIMVPKDRLPEVEASLMAAGWATTHHSKYDQRYYREWMHELPPLRHIRRQTVLDVHHAILPETARLKPSAEKLLRSATRLADRKGYAVLSPVDMVLHSMVHLFHNDDLTHALRDLSDLDLLLRLFGRDTAFWPALVDRSRELDLARPLHYGLRYAQTKLHTPVPPDTLAAAAEAGPGAAGLAIADALWSRALRPPHALASDAFTPLARMALYARAHWLRMPSGLLVRHLTIKALKLHERGEPAPIGP